MAVTRVAIEKCILMRCPTGLIDVHGKWPRTQPAGQGWRRLHRKQCRSARERYVVCVRYNAKDRDGRYTGLKQGVAIFAGGRFDGFNEQPKGACDQAEFKPFPELEKLSR
jgi:hypothetical protein